jgi:hypothetical protein
VTADEENEIVNFAAKWLTLVLALVVMAPQAAWKEYVSTEGRFSVLMPGTPSKQKVSTKQGADTIEIYIVAAEAKKGEDSFGVTYADFPEPVVQKTPATVLLEGARDGMLKQQSGKLLADRAISLGEYPGREFTIKSGEEKVFAKAILVRRRLYQVVAAVPERRADTKDVDQFLASFKLLPPPK